MNTLDRDGAATDGLGHGSRPPFDKRFAIFAACVFAVALAANLFCCFGLGNGRDESRATGQLAVARPSAEAVVRMSIARELFASDSRGYHALIDSALMAPLPTLVAVPFLPVDRVTIAGWGVGAGFYVLTSLLSALAAYYLLFLARRLELNWLFGAAAAAVLLFNPWTPLGAWRGTSATGSLLLATAACAHLISWLRATRGVDATSGSGAPNRAGRSRGLLSLGLSANILAFAIVWDPWFLALAVVVAALVAGHAAVEIAEPWEARAPGRLEGLMLICLTPMLYIPAIWALFNWLIFKDVLRLTRDAAPLVAPWLALVAIGAGALAICACLVARLTSRAVLATGLVYLLAAAGVGALAAVPPSNGRNAILGQAIATESDRRDSEELSRYLRETKGGRMILVIGRPGYLIENIVGDDTAFIHRLDLDVPAVLKDTPGRKVFAVLTEAQIEWWKPRLERQSPGLWDWNFLEDRRIGQWRVLACIRPA